MEDDDQLPPWLAGNPVLDARDDEENRPSLGQRIGATPGHVRAAGRTVRSSTDARSSILDEALCHRLTDFVFAADPKSQKRGLPADRASAPTNVDARTELNGAVRELRNTAVFATGGLPRQKTPKTTGAVTSVEITHCAPGAHPTLS